MAQKVEKVIKTYNISFFILLVLLSVLLDGVIGQLHQNLLIKVWISSLIALHVLSAACSNIPLLVEIAPSILGVYKDE